MWALRRQILSAASFRANVLVVGETGSGKERVAKAIHEASAARGRFVALNMSGIDPSIAGSELFGHSRGAFTGAYDNQSGAFEEARDGTLFLDEIAGMPMEVQKKLLRVLEERRFSPLGSRAVHDVRCRIIAASNSLLEVEVAAGRFRYDLFERLKALYIPVPPLRERRGDIPRLFRAFLAEETREHPELSWVWRDAGGTDRPPIPMEFFVDLLRDSWAGNVRALRNFAVGTAAVNLGARTFVAPPAAPALTPAPVVSVKTVGHVGASGAARRSEPLVSPLGRDALLSLLDEHGFRQAVVAQRLGISRNTLIEWMKAHGIRRAKDLDDAEIAAARAEAGGDLAAMARLLRVSLRGLKLRLGSSD